ncbi:MAG: PP2C family protein-serine/threonine phosphatase [Candidatus Acidiferrales bacterium]
MAMLPSRVLTALASPSFSLAGLRSQTPVIIAGFILLAVGMAALTLFFFRSKSSDLALIYFSIFSILYALRLLLRMQVVRSLADVSDSFADHLNLWITFTLLIPFLLFLREVLGPQIKALVNRLLIALVTLAVVAITADLFGVGESFAFSVNNYLVLAIIGGLTANLIILRSRGLGQPWTGEYRALTIGLAVFGAFVLHGNLADLGLWRGGPNDEVLGFVFFVGCLGYVAAHRTFANEYRLLAIDKELEIARHIQSSILPRAVPSIAGLEIAARYLPMSAVAGDFYDFLSLDNNQLGILVADVTGHGIPAALIASMLKGAFAGQKTHAQHPELVLVGLNEALCGKFEEHFVTAAYMYADIDAKIMRYAGAGHPPLLFSSRSNGHARSIEQNGLFLGMFPEAAYSSLEIPLKPGDRYVLYTDGLLESTNSKAEEFGLSRCKQFLESHRLLTAAELADQMLGEIARWSARSSGRPQEDDMTLIVMDCQGQS